jgi:uncharacterized protein YecT (DUF1311 family)
MLQITAPQATLIVAAITLVGGLVGWFGRGFTFLLHRWWTGAPKREDAAYLHSVVDLAGKMQASGMTMNEVRQFESIMRAPAVASSPGANEVVDSMSSAEAEPAAFQTNVGMQVRTRAAHDVADAALEQAVTDLHLMMGERESELLNSAQEHWRAYRDALVQCAYYEYEGGSHAPLAAGLAGLSETERRTAELRSQVQERAAR